MPPSGGQSDGEGKPETFNFLGFTHICGTSQKTGYFMVYRERPSGKRMAAKLKDITAEAAKAQAARVDRGNTRKWLQAVVRGYFQYHAVPGNEQRLKAFRQEVLRIWLRQLRRRSQRSRWTWEKFQERLGNQLPEVDVLHPYPEVRLRSTTRLREEHPRQEPCALAAPARICAGGIG